jgi:hypothetical protein
MTAVAWISSLDYAYRCQGTGHWCGGDLGSPRHRRGGESTRELREILFRRKARCGGAGLPAEGAPGVQAGHQLRRLSGRE